MRNNWKSRGKFMELLKTGEWPAVSYHCVVLIDRSVDRLMMTRQRKMYHWRNGRKCSPKNVRAHLFLIVVVSV